jgi:xylan 1,4-beta-xylosidase
MGSPQSPNADEIAELKAAGQLEMLGSPQWVDVRGGKVEIPMALPRESVELVRVRWE